MAEDLTPKHLRCFPASCPSIHRLEDGRLQIRGEYVRMHMRSFAKEEATIIISPDLLDTLIEDGVLNRLRLISEEVAKLRERNALQASALDVAAKTEESMREALKEFMSTYAADEGLGFDERFMDRSAPQDCWILARAALSATEAVEK